MNVFMELGFWDYFIRFNGVSERFKYDGCGRYN